MSELKNMLAGGPYHHDEELDAIWRKGKSLMQQYNTLPFADVAAQQAVLREFLGGMGENVHISAPFYVDYGKFIKVGSNVEINMNCVFLDCNWITLGNNVLIGPNVQIYAVGHPISPKEREKDYLIGLTKPVTIGDNVWVGGGSVIVPGVTIGNNVTIGAGSVVTKDIPDNVLAYGNPCRVVRRIE
jgi:maltose O-acetyltransferase